MATRYMQNNSRTWEAANFNTELAGGGSAGAPASGDTVRFVRGGASITTGHTATGLTGGSALALGVFTDGWKGNLGASGSALDADFTELRWGSPGDGWFAGAIGSCNVLTTGDRLGALNLSGSITGMLKIQKGNVRLVNGFSACPEAEIVGGRLDVDDGATVTVVNVMRGGLAVLNETPTAIYVKNGGRAILTDVCDTDTEDPSSSDATETPVRIGTGGTLEVRGYVNLPHIIMESGSTLILDEVPDDIELGSNYAKYEEGAKIFARTKGSKVTFNNDNTVITGAGPDVLASLEVVEGFFKTG